MDIGFVSSHVYPYTKGGVEKRVYEVGKRLSARGHEVTVYGFQWWDGPRVMESEGMTLWGIATPGDQFTRDRRSITEALKFAVKLGLPLYRNGDRHDIIDIASSAEQFPILTGRVVSAIHKSRLVTTWHEVWTYAYWRQYLGVLGSIAWTIQRAALSIDQYPVAVSELTAERLAQSGFHPDNIEVIPNGVDIGAIEGVQPKADGYDLLYVGRLIPEKNVDVLLSAFDRVADRVPGVELGIIGTGDEREKLDALRDSLNNGHRISFLETFEDHRDVYAHMRAAKVFVLPSTREGFGITVVEAMAAGCTPVVVDHPDSAAIEVVGSCGYTPNISVPELATAIERGLERNGGRSDPVERAAQYDWDRITDEVETYYRELLRKQAEP